jgi:hypothetical protein
VRIPAEALEEKEGEYILQLTEELWEIFYVDEVKLVAVDHPDTIDIYVNERFVPPGPASLTVHQVAGGRVPVTATDGEGSDVLPQIRDQDDVYVSNLRPTRYQGVVELHDLILDLGEIPGSEPVTLYLNGWIFPTDASINVAMSQSRRDSVIAPYLEVIGAGGEWTRAIDDLGFPAGKSKTVIADLTGKFPTPDRERPPWTPRRPISTSGVSLASTGREAGTDLTGSSTRRSPPTRDGCRWRAPSRASETCSPCSWSPTTGT